MMRKYSLWVLLVISFILAVIVAPSLYLSFTKERWIVDWTNFSVPADTAGSLMYTFIVMGVAILAAIFRYRWGLGKITSFLGAWFLGSLCSIALLTVVGMIVLGDLYSLTRFSLWHWTLTDGPYIAMNVVVSILAVAAGLILGRYSGMKLADRPKEDETPAILESRAGLGR